MSSYNRTEISLGRKLKFNQLLVFDRVLETGSLLRAANDLGLTQPAVTKTIQELEKCFEGPLLERSNRGVNPTALGVLLGRRVKSMMSELRSLTDEVNAFSDGSGGRVIVGTLIAASAKLLPRAIARLKQRAPRVLVTVREANTAQLFPALASGDLDIVVGRLPEAASPLASSFALDHHLLFQESLCVVGGARHWKDRPPPVRVANLMTEAWILPLQESPSRVAAHALFAGAQLGLPEDVVESLSMLTNIGLMIETPRIGLMPRAAAQQFVDVGLLCVLEVAEASAFGAVGYSVRSGHALTAASQRFIDCLREVAGSLSRGNR